MPNRPPKHWMRRCVEHVGFHSPKARDPGAICASTFRKLSKNVKEVLLRAEKSKKRKKR